LRYSVNGFHTKTNPEITNPIHTIPDVITRNVKFQRRNNNVTVSPIIIVIRRHSTLKTARRLDNGGTRLQ